MILLSLVFTSIVTVKLVSGSTAGSDWGYKSGYAFADPKHWKNAYPICGGVYQSPIDVTTRFAQYSDKLMPISITGTASTTVPVNLEKHTTSAYLTFGAQWNMMVGDRTCLRPVSIHWHWGSDASKGSEHMMDTVSYPMEGHLITFNCNNYTSMDTAKSSVNGLYVFGIFYEIGSDGSALQKVVEAMDRLTPGTLNTTSLAEISPKDLLPSDLKNYFQYDGSLTTPPCTENVKWTLLKSRLSITTDQINKFRSLTFEAPETGNMVNNNRPTNEVHSRVIYSSFKRGLLLKWSAAVMGVQLGAIVLLMATI